MGNPPARIFLTAYGLMEFTDMAKVYPVDGAVIERAAQWLLRQQQPDGTWQVSDRRAGQGAMGATAYAAWALIQAGYEDTSEVGEAIGYIREFALLPLPPRERAGVRVKTPTAWRWSPTRWPPTTPTTR